MNKQKKNNDHIPRKTWNIHDIVVIEIMQVYKRPSFHLTDTSSLLHQLHATLTMYTGIPVDNKELYNLKWLTWSNIIERSREVKNTELPLAINC